MSDVFAQESAEGWELQQLVEQAGERVVCILGQSDVRFSNANKPRPDLCVRSRLDIRDDAGEAGIVICPYAELLAFAHLPDRTVLREHEEECSNHEPNFLSLEKHIRTRSINGDALSFQCTSEFGNLSVRH